MERPRRFALDATRLLWAREMILSVRNALMYSIKMAGMCRLKTTYSSHPLPQTCMHTQLEEFLIQAGLCGDASYVTRAEVMVALATIAMEFATNVGAVGSATRVEVTAVSAAIAMEFVINV